MIIYFTNLYEDKALKKKRVTKIIIILNSITYPPLLSKLQIKRSVYCFDTASLLPPTAFPDAAVDTRNFLPLSVATSSLLSFRVQFKDHHVQFQTVKRT